MIRSVLDWAKGSRGERHRGNAFVDFVVRVPRVVPIEWRGGCHELKNEDTECPPVDRPGMSCRGDDFGREIYRCPTRCVRHPRPWPDFRIPAFGLIHKSRNHALVEMKSE